MQVVSRALRNLLIVLCVLAVIYVIATNYSFVFSKSVRGEVMEVERVIQPTAMLGSSMTAEQMFSFAILVRTETGEIFTSSSTDRQWAVVRKGYCVETRLYPYPPWDMEKADTYFNARLVKVLADCKRAAPLTGAAASTEIAPGSSPTAAQSAPGQLSANGTAVRADAGVSPTPAAPPTPNQLLGLPGTQPNAKPALPHGMSN
jgi:hypothetical protein